MKRVIIVAFAGATTLDITGPAEVFAAARTGDGKAAYRVVLAAVGGGAIETTSTICLQTRALERVRPRSGDLIVVAGGEEQAILSAVADRYLRRWLVSAARVVERVASVCSGAFVLAAAGLLDGKRATTHWAACARLSQMFPRVKVDANAIFVRDHETWTSAGVTTGIDMALALVEQDLGRAAADAIAATLVLYLRRPGFQSQFSDALVAQLGASDPLANVVAFIRQNLSASVETVARGTGHSVRTLHRRCLQHVGLTPAKLLDRLRVERARTLLASGAHSSKRLASLCGFSSATHLKRAFVRELGMGAREYSLLHPAATAAE